MTQKPRKKIGWISNLTYSSTFSDVLDKLGHPSLKETKGILERALDKLKNHQAELHSKILSPILALSKTPSLSNEALSTLCQEQHSADDHPYQISNYISSFDFIVQNILKSNLSRDDQLGNIYIWAVYMMVSLDTGHRNNIQHISQSAEADQNLLRLLSHDLKNPIAVQSGFMKILKKELPKDFLKTLRPIEDSIKNMTEILSEVGQLMAIRSGKTKMDISPLSLFVILSRFESIATPILEPKKINLRFEPALTEELPWAMGNEPALLHHILLNLLTNAKKFSKKNTTITVITRKEENHVKISIMDQGIGIPKKLREHLFKAHVATTKKGTDGEKGTGFGLPIVKQFIEYMDGDIAFDTLTPEDEAGTTGTTFHVKLPIADSSVNKNSLPEDLTTGFAELDNQHQKLLRTIHHLRIADTKDTIDTAMMNLYNYLLEHFHFEEVLMEKYDFPNRHEHIAHHNQFTEEAEDFYTNLQSSSEAIAKLGAKKVVQQTMQWLEEHISVEDRAIVDFINEKDHDTKDKEILIVEDNESLLATFKELISDQGIKVIIAKNGREALEILDKILWVDLIVTDLTMPQIAGIDLIRKLKESKTYSKIPVCVLSGTVSIQDMRDLNKLGVSAFLTKPINWNLLNDTIRKNLFRA